MADLDFLNKLERLKEQLAAHFKKLVKAEQTYNAESEKAQSGKAVAEGIDKSVGDINGALSNLTEPSDVDPVEWMDKTIDAAVEEINTQNAATIATQIEGAISQLSAQNEGNIKKQISEAVESLDTNVRRAFLSNVKRVKDGNVAFEENTIHVIARVPDGNVLTVYNPDTLEPITISDRHYCIIVGNVGDDVPGAVCATVLSYPSLDPQLYVVKDATHQSTLAWTGTAICSSVKNALVE